MSHISKQSSTNLMCLNQSASATPDSQTPNCRTSIVRIPSLGCPRLWSINNCQIDIAATDGSSLGIALISAPITLRSSSSCSTAPLDRYELVNAVAAPVDMWRNEECLCVCVCGDVFETKRFRPLIGCILPIKQDAESTNSTVMLFDSIYVDRSEPIGSMPVPLHLLQEDHTERYGRIDVGQQYQKIVFSLMQ
ncbi:hypothetical protein M436DRAFT_63368 [Aureobasidium namibiae CBS 147.97]|uniref:Uncharacterized protein n=1 Tax=Aureobasidium namibiae CBS 147.97 TaxID=1043004 RepID=A0A074WLP0_9PEZI|nr:uncharacterized protein M436DRAFT_63368 [Aureobasidium namibiae CBS 147.97]KEQ74030.1 hypothetical protein M436DRAFT_63368 [Aureobasidium namibiae CBS 147.97]